MAAQLRVGEPAAMAEMNITPLVDVMLVLLIIFMIAAPILTHRITLDLPQPIHWTEPPPPPPEVIDLSVAADGTLLWNGAPLVAGALEPQLEIEARRNPQPELQVEVDPHAAFQEVVTVLAAAKNAKLERIAFKR